MSVDPVALCSQWTAAYDQLSHAIAVFETACNAIDSLAFQAGDVPESAQPNFFLSVEANLPLLKQKRDTFDRSLEKLRKFRNRSTQLVPINRLPSELLASIISIVVDTSRTGWNAWDYELSMTAAQELVHTVSSVSSYWRQVCLATPTLWANIRFHRMRGLDHAALWLERSQSCPLRLSFPDKTYPGREQDLDELLQRHSNRLRSLVVAGNGHGAGWKAFRAACAQHTENSVRLESLGISATYDFPGEALSELGLLPKDQMDRYVKSVRNLYVICRLFDDWTSTAFHELTTLALKGIYGQISPTVEEFLNVLRASPRLRSLEIAGSLIKTVPESVNTQVTLDSLETLWLERTGTQFAKWLLNSIIPHEHRLDLVLDHVQKSGTLGYNSTFGVPNIVRTLHILFGHFRTCKLDLSGLAKSLNKLETLGLYGCKIKLKNSTAHHEVPDHSMLTTLELDHCQGLDAPGFVSMLAECPIHRLRIADSEGGPTEEKLLESLPALVVTNDPKRPARLRSPFH